MKQDVRPHEGAAAVFEKVTKVYPRGWTSRRITALDQVSFSVPWGEVFGLVGPNRSGKTTLVKVLLSICRPTKGRVMRLGSPLSDRSTLARIGYVHENPSFPRYLTARQLLEGYGRLSGISGRHLRTRSAELLDRVGLADRSREPIARFSKGMLQRLALAQALVNDPKLLVLDEPSEGMDLPARKLLADVICQQREAGHSVILVSHALGEVGRLCDRVAVLREGRVAYVGRVDELAHDEIALEQSNFESALEPLYEGALA
jgi:ABC-2 type transport system ATP-binding protein